MGRTRSGSADLPGEPGQAEVRSGECPKLEQRNDREEDHKAGAAIDVPARHRPPLPTQALRRPRAGDGIDERPQQEDDDDARRDDDGHQQLGAELDELEEEKKITFRHRMSYWKL